LLLLNILSLWTLCCTFSLKGDDIEKARERPPTRSTVRSEYDDEINDMLQNVIETTWSDDSEEERPDNDETYGYISSSSLEISELIETPEPNNEVPPSAGVIECTPSEYNNPSPGELEPIVMDLYEIPRPGHDWHTVEALAMPIPPHGRSALDIFWRLEVRERQPHRRTYSTGERYGWLTGGYSAVQTQESLSATYYSNFTHSIAYTSFVLCNQLSVYPPYTDFDFDCARYNHSKWRARF
jgi:hypothetical protein